MDDTSLNAMIQLAAHAIGMTPGTLAITLGIVVFAGNAISRIIPDTATGVLGTVRKAATFVGLHIRNNSGTLPLGTGVPGVVIPTILAGNEDSVPISSIVKRDAEIQAAPVTDMFAKAKDAAKSIIGGHAESKNDDGTDDAR